ncbi:MAG TPA: Gfo/Idh/MocA family oxidoreductase [Candidatus Cloacimonadota bacterium]|nr:Gfo/Idh/MocA family oxidoreductase [Candidatus Cloacimonadota bacterium]HPM01031.1 Gfo/Idh/MocA family oxidoreductase [Candidatus Cloacimonadota bacterium]
MLKVGVVGVGHLGKHHARIFNQIADCQLVGVYDKVFDRAKEIADMYQVKTFENYEDMLNEVDAVDVAATTTWHYDLAKPALLKGCHVFLEKPITSEIAQAEELLKIAKEKNLFIQVGHIERFNPVILKVEDEIQNPMFIESHRLAPFNPRGSDVPVVLDLMIHDIDLILSFVKSDISDIRASGVGILTPSIDIANARLEFENGAIANVTASRISMKRERKIRFFQKDAYISLDFQEKKVSVLRKSENINKILPQILMGNTNFDPQDLVDMKEINADDITKDALTMELESFVSSINENKNPIVDGEAGTKALRIAMEIMDKIKRKSL